MAKVAEIVHIVHLTLPTSLHYLVERRCSKFLWNTGFITIMLRFGVKVKRAYCCDNFFAWRPLPDIRRLSGDDYCVSLRWRPGASSTRRRRIPGARVRCERRVVVY